jgi:hypothetical protein
MTAVRFYVDDERAGRLFRRATQRIGDRIRKAVRQAADDAADDIEEKVRDDISSAGRFGSRWTEGFKVDVTEGGGNVRVEADTEAMPPYWRIFQTGGTIHGNPLLWIPLSIFGNDAQGVSAKDYPGRLFRVNRKDGKAPLLLAAGSGKGDAARPLYFGKESVFEPKKFHVDEIVAAESRTMDKRVKENMAATKDDK